ncbi:MAG: DUF4168 domain-containing protein [Ectothiorhodospiraceae bacterium]|nr:DUF4168 domain-containing protein [Ectothiorhodospiraceae bacterium]
MPRKNRAALLLAIILGTGLAATSTGVLANDIYENEAASSTTLTSADISDRQLAAFLDAAGHVQSIRSSYVEMIREAPAEERAELREGAVADMTTAIQFTGLDVETYRAIGYLFRNDPELRQRLNRVAAGR